MITQLSEETINEYATEAQSIQQPTGTDFTQGVSVGRTIPAKWWNWLFNAATKRIFQGKNDAQNMLTELQNVVTDAGITLDGTDNTQLSQAVTAKADEQIDAFIEEKRGYFIHWNNTPIPEVPNNWTYRRASTGGTPYSNALTSGSSDCACIVAYRDTAGAQIDDFKVSVNSDGKGWSPWIDIHMFNPIVPSYRYSAVMRKFKGRYFLYLVGTISGSWQNGHAGQMFVSDDLSTWTSMFTIYYYHSNQANPSNSEYPSFGWSDDALYVMSKEGESASATTKLRVTYDGYRWTEIANGFAYPVSAQSKITVPSDAQKVIPYGANGFLWGCYAFDGTNFAPVVSDVTAKAAARNPCVFNSGKVFYPSATNGYCFIAPSLGAQAVAVQLSESIDTTNTSARFVCNRRYIAMGTYGGPEAAYTKALNSIKLIDDTGAVTDFPHPPRAEGATYDYMPIELNGVIYCGRYRTTSDFEHWELMSNLPEGTSPKSFIFDCADSHMLGLFDPVLRDNTRYVSCISKDVGVTWREQDALGFIRGDILFDDCCWGIDTYSNTPLGCVTYNSSNRVIGNTLYLR